MLNNYYFNKYYLILEFEKCISYLEVSKNKEIPKKFLNIFYINKDKDKKILCIRREILFFLQEFPYSYQDFLFEIVNFVIFNLSKSNYIDDWSLEDIDQNQEPDKDESLFLNQNLIIDSNILKIWSNFINAQNETLILIKNKENEISNDDFLEI